MSVYYFNGAQILAPLSITSNEPMYEVETVSLKIQRASQDVQRWELNFGVVGTAETQVDLLVGSVTNVDTVESMTMPQLPSVDAANTIGVSRAITSGAAAGASSVPINSNGVLSKGSFIKFSNHNKLYLVTADVASGNPVSVAIYPPLRSAVTTAHTLKTGVSAVLTYKRSIDNATGITFTDGVLSSLGSITLIEAL